MQMMDERQVAWIRKEKQGASEEEQEKEVRGMGEGMVGRMGQVRMKEGKLTQ